MIDKAHFPGLRAQYLDEHAQTPLAIIRAYRETGRAIVTIERARRTPRRHRVSLRRYALLRAWTITRAVRIWRTGGYSDRSSFAVSLWRTL